MGASLLKPDVPQRSTTVILGEAPAARPAGNLVLATLGGLVAAVMGALLWATLVSVSHFKIGYAAISIGFLVGWTMRALGKGHTPVYGCIGAVLALLGCVGGDVLTDCIILAQQYSKSTMDVVSHLTPALVSELLQSSFKALDALFYVLAMMAGYRHAFFRH